MDAVMTWPGRVEDWLDARGKGAWIAAMVLAFVLVWPLGLLLLGYMIYARKFGRRRTEMIDDTRRTLRRNRMAPSGNLAFDAYRADTLRRLEEEQAAFDAFLLRLREAKDKSEFDAFMQDRLKAASAPARPDADADHPGSASR
jgi:hypothetical protein